MILLPLKALAAPDLVGGAALLAAGLAQAAADPVPVPDGFGGWVVYALTGLGLGGLLLWAGRKALEDWFARQQEERAQDTAERDRHRAMTEQQMASLRDDVARIAQQRDVLIKEVIGDLRADRDFYRQAFLEERSRADACQARLPAPPQ